LTLEVFHNIEKPVIDIWLICELDLNLVEITESILGTVSIAKYLVTSIRTRWTRSNKSLQIATVRLHD
jgi:hypothetical protein